MRTLRRLGRWLKDAKGVATSLIEATATVAVGAVLAGVAVGGAIDAINDSKIQAAIGDSSVIGQGVVSFYTDNSFFPVFKDGNQTGSGDTFFQDLVSENGTYPTDSSPGKFWGIPTTPPVWDETGFFCHKPDYSLHDTIEGHLVKNELGRNATKFYPLRGTYSGDTRRGWAGPYVGTLPKTDPWGNKYLINIRELHTGHLLDTAFAGTHGANGPGNVPKVAVIVLSAGPNRTIETSAEQRFDDFVAFGDDIIFRIK